MKSWVVSASWGTTSERQSSGHCTEAQGGEANRPQAFPVQSVRLQQLRPPTSVHKKWIAYKPASRHVKLAVSPIDLATSRINTRLFQGREVRR